MIKKTNNKINESIMAYIQKQVDFFSIPFQENEKIQLHHIDFCIDKMSFLYRNIKEKYFNHDDFELWDIHNSDKYAIFLYWLSHILYLENKEILATRIYLLNKMLHGIDLFFTRKMPDIFMLSHPLGSIFGNAKYSDYLLVLQNCTIGGWGGAL